MKISIEILFKPNQKHLQQIEDWLLEEEEATRNGFYCNWNIIKNSYENNEMSIIVLNKVVIGFVIWQIYHYSATINIIEINPKYRGQQFGNLLINQLFQFFKTKGIVVVELQCAPETSESYWKLQKFIEFPDFERWNSGNKKLYKILVPHCKYQKLTDKFEQIQLWDDEPYATKNKKPVWTWKIKYKKGTNKLIEPIIFPSDYNWRICWKKDNEIFVDDKVKYFDKQKIIEGKFIYINELIK